MNTINLKKLRWSNTFSYAEGNEISLCDAPVVQILGENGAGKSSIALTLEEGLYNKNSKGVTKADIPNRLLNKPYSIGVDFEVLGSEYALDIHKASSLKATLLKDGEDISSNTATGTLKTAEDALGMSFKTFSQLINQNLDSSLQFLTATDSARKTFLIDLFDLSEYTEKQSKYSDALKVINADIKVKEGSLSNIQSNLTRISKDLTVEIGERSEVPEEKTGLLDKKAELELQLKNIRQDTAKIKDSNQILDSIEKLRSLEEIEGDIALLDIKDKTPLSEELGRRNSEISSAKQIVQKIEGLSGKCPTCLGDIDQDFVNTLLTQNNKIIEDNRTEALKLSEELKQITAQEKEKAALLKEKRDTEALLGKKIFDEKKSLPDSSAIQAELTDIEAEIRNNRAAISKANDLNRQIDIQEAKLEKAKEDHQNYLDQEKETKDSLERLADKVGPLEVLKKAFSSTGLVAYKLENKVKDLEYETNEYLGKLSAGRFHLTFELNKDKLNVVILDRGKEVTIKSVSTGQKARITISTLLGIRKVMQSISKQSINVLFLDEIISVLDDHGKEQLVELLLEEKNLNTFLVSHGWKHPLVSKLYVTEEDGISYVTEG